MGSRRKAERIPKASHPLTLRVARSRVRTRSSDRNLGTPSPPGVISQAGGAHGMTGSAALAPPLGNGGGRPSPPFGGRGIGCGVGGSLVEVVGVGMGVGLGYNNNSNDEMRIVIWESMVCGSSYC